MQQGQSLSLLHCNAVVQDSDWFRADAEALKHQTPSLMEPKPPKTCNFPLIYRLLGPTPAIRNHPATAVQPTGSPLPASSRISAPPATWKREAEPVAPEGMSGMKGM